jgi:hypothetical protein
MDVHSTTNVPMLSINPSNCEPRQVYKMMTGLIVPRPIALVSTVDRTGVANHCAVLSNASRCKEDRRWPL